MVKKLYNYKKRKNYVPRPVKKYVKKILDNTIENKIIGDLMEEDFGSISNAWHELNLTTLSQGSGKTSRIGTVIHVKSLEIRGVVTGGMQAAVGDDPWNVLRIVLGKYNSPDVNNPLTTAGVGMESICRADWLNAGGRLVKKYMDKYVVLDTIGGNNAATGYIPKQRIFKYYKKFKPGDLTIKWNADAGDSTSQTKLILSMISDSAAVTHPGFTHGYWCMTFEDA